MVRHHCYKRTLIIKSGEMRLAIRRFAAARGIVGVSEAVVYGVDGSQPASSAVVVGRSDLNHLNGNVTATA